MNKSRSWYFKLGGGIFLLYLCIHYWPSVSLFLGSLFSAAMPLFLGFALAFPVNILMSFYERRYFPASSGTLLIKSRRPVCLILALLTMAGIIALVVGLVLPELVACVQLIISQLPGLIESALDWAQSLDFIPESLLQSLAEVDWESQLSSILSIFTSGVSGIVTTVYQAVTSVISGLVTAFLSLIFAIYLLAGKDRLKIQAVRLLRRWCKERRCRQIAYAARILNESFHNFIVGQCTEAVILGILCTLGMLLLRIPYATMIGALVAFTALIPIAGAYIGAIVGALIILTVSPVKALIFLVFLVVLQQLEGNLIYPRVVGSSIGLPAIWVLAAITIGGGILGVSGMLLGVPLAAAVYRILRDDVNRHENSASTEKPPAP